MTGGDGAVWKELQMNERKMEELEAAEGMEAEVDTVVTSVGGPGPT